VLHGAFEALSSARSVIVEVDERRNDSSAIGKWLDVFNFTRTGRHVCPFTPQSPIGMDHFVRR